MDELLTHSYGMRTVTILYGEILTPIYDTSY